MLLYYTYNMELRSAITDYYFTHIADLPPEKRFHFASRMLAWSGDERARQLLRDLRAVITDDAKSRTDLTHSLEELVGEQPGAHIPGIHLREPYFERYPELFGIHQALFRVRHLRSVYNLDARGVFLEIVPRAELLDLERRLLADPPALLVLSTYAVNYLYLLRRMLLEDEQGIDVKQLAALGQNQVPDDPEQLRLWVYLYTHCIIADSNFYTRPVAPALLPDYHAMLASIEQVITARFAAISLDVKLEFLVCCRITSYPAKLYGRIDQECAASAAPDGTFIIDTHNSFANLQNKKTFAASEHRNVLFIMSGTPYTPHATLV